MGSVSITVSTDVNAAAIFPLGVSVSLSTLMSMSLPYFHCWFNLKASGNLTMEALKRQISIGIFPVKLELMLIFLPLSELKPVLKNYR